jgi:hypothetical protein
MLYTVYVDLRKKILDIDKIKNKNAKLMEIRDVCIEISMHIRLENITGEMATVLCGLLSTTQV